MRNVTKQENKKMASGTKLSQKQPQQPTEKKREKDQQKQENYSNLTARENNQMKRKEGGKSHIQTTR
jgi:hypothetical protein